MEFILKSDRFYCITLKRRWCDIVVNVHAPSEDEENYIKDSFYDQLRDF